jgi:hypothetical protein
MVAGAQPKAREGRGAAPGHWRAGVFRPAVPGEGALMAIEDINKAGGIKSLGGAKIEALLGDAQSTAAGRHGRESRS